MPATGASERVDERPVGRGRSPATFAAQHLGSTCWPSSVSERRGRDQPKGCSSSRRSVVAGVHEEGSLEFPPRWLPAPSATAPTRPARWRRRPADAYAMSFSFLSGRTFTDALAGLAFTSIVSPGICPICALLTPCQAGASPLSVQRGVSPRAVELRRRRRGPRPGEMR